MRRCISGLNYCIIKINRNYLTSPYIELKSMQLTTRNVEEAQKGVIMGINNKKNHLFRSLIFFIMLLFVMGLTMNVLFCSNYNLYELIDKTTVTKTWEISENTVCSEDDNDTTHFKVSFLSNNNSHTETITKNICPIPVIAAIPKGFSLLFFLIIVFLYFFLTLFRLLPDEWTLISQKVRLDN